MLYGRLSEGSASITACENEDAWSGCFGRSPVNAKD